MKNNFNIQRCWNFIKQDIVFGKTTYMHSLLAFFIGFLAFMVIISLSRWFGLVPVEAAFVDMMSKIGSVIFFYYAMAIVAGTFAHLETPQKRIAFLMLPVQNSEKFVGKIAISSFLIIVVLPLLYICSDGLRMLIEWGITQQTGTCAIAYTFGYLKKILEVKINVNEISVVMNGMIAYSVTFFLLCSTAFRKKAFIKGVAMYCMVNFVVMTSIITLIALMAHKEHVSIGENDIDLHIFGIALICANIKLWLVSLLNIWLSYTNFRKNSVV